MKRTLSICTLLVLSLFFLFSCGGEGAEVIPEEKIDFSHIGVGNTVDGDEVAVYLNFDSEYKVSKIESEGVLLDRRGNTVRLFDETMTFNDPTRTPAQIIMVDIEDVGRIADVSFTKVKAYTTESLSTDMGEPAATVGASRHGTAIVNVVVISIFVMAAVGALSIAVIRFVILKQDREDSDEAQDNPPSVKEVERGEPISEDAKMDKFEEIKKYKELLDMGIITQEEFEAKKKKLL